MIKCLFHSKFPSDHARPKLKLYNAAFVDLSGLHPSSPVTWNLTVEDTRAIARLLMQICMLNKTRNSIVISCPNYKI